MQIDQDELELLERRMAERIENRVRGRLFVIYGTIGAGILATFTYFGYDIIKSIKPSLIAAATDSTKVAIQPVLDEATSAADDAVKLALRSEAELHAMENFRRDAQLRLNSTLDKVNEVTDNIESSLKEITENLDSAGKDVEAYRQRSTDLFLSVNYEDTIKEIAKNVDMLTVAVASLKTDTSSAALQNIDVSNSKATLEAVMDRSPAPLPEARTTVYFQFAGVTRELAEEISRNLDDSSFHFPGEERVAAAANKSEVRYFFEEDMDQAILLAKRANEVLESMALEANVSARFVQLAKGSPRRGILELWLEPKPL